MFAMVIQGGITPAQRDDMNQAVTESLIPALVQEAGVRGAVNLEDRSTGHGMMLIFWDTEEQALRPPSSPALLKALSAILRISTGERAPASCWRVNAVQFDSGAEEPTSKGVRAV